MKQIHNEIYISPQLEVVDMGVDSVLCASTGKGNQDYGISDSDGWF